MNMGIIDIESKLSHVVSKVICLKCNTRWISVRPEHTLLEQIECKNCGAGFVIETGERLYDEEERVK